MTFGIRKPAWKLKVIVKIRTRQVFPEMKPVNIIFFPVSYPSRTGYKNVVRPWPQWPM